MKQIIYIHGGSRYPDNEAFCKALETWTYTPLKNTKKWKYWLQEQTKDTFEMFIPNMPNQDFASYKAWKIWFEKTFPYLNDEGVILIGHSLGSSFLLKYLIENGFPKKLLQLHLVSAVVDGRDRPEEKQFLGDFGFKVDRIGTLADVAEKIFIYHSTDDDMVPYSHALTIKSFLPDAELLTFSDRGHMRQAEFPELLENILK